MNIAQHIERAGHLFPNKQALIFEGQSFTYSEIDEMSNRVANALAGEGISRGDRVALFLPNIPPFVIVYLGIQKMGGIAVSFNPTLKTEEIKFILEDSGAKVIVTTETLRRNVPPKELPQLNLRLIAEGDAKGAYIALSEWMANASPKAQAVDMAHDEPAAILYTSGTTGFPKGVTLSHGNVVSNVRTCVDVFETQPEDRILLFLPVFHAFGQIGGLNSCFEASATLVLHSKFEIEPILKSIVNNGVTIFLGVPTIYTLLYDQASTEQMRSVRLYISGAATLPLEIARKWHEKFGVVINEAYGLTENSLACFNPFGKSKPGSVGLPVEGVEIKIVDAEGNEVAPDELGEVTICGPNVMLGYWNRPVETAEVIKEGWFHTGDIGKMDEDGYFYIVDRVKDMVIVGGMNVYPSEVEKILYQHPAVAEVAVYGVPEALLGEQVIASIILKPGEAVTAEEIIAFCRQNMANFKVPSQVEFVDELPKNRIGKILKKVLREKVAFRDGSTIDLPTPLVVKNEDIRPFIEGKIVESLAGVLQIDRQKLKTDASYTNLGVDSILAVNIINRLNDKLAIQLKTIDLFNYPTIRQLVDHIVDEFGHAIDSVNFTASDELKRWPDSHGHDKPSTQSMNTLLKRNGYLPVSIEQERMWIVEQLKPTGTVFTNIVKTGFQLTGQLNITALEQSINEIVRRHDVLRTTFALVEGHPVQKIIPHLSMTLQMDDFQQLDKSLIAQIADEEARRSFDLTQGPLWRFKLMQLGKSDYLLLLVIHHIICDALSIPLFLKELAVLYEAFRLEKPSPLSQIVFQYGDFAVWQRQWLQSQSLREALAFWKKQLEGAPPLLELPTDRPRPLLRSFQCAHKPFQLPKDLSAAILKFSEEQNVTVFITLMAGFKTLLYQYAGLEDLLVGFFTSGRVRQEVESLIGPFAYPVVSRTDLSGNPSFRELLGRVNKTLMEASTHKVVPFGKVVEALAPERSSQYNPLIQVMFTFVGDLNYNINLPSLTLKPIDIDEILPVPTVDDLTLGMGQIDGVLHGYLAYQIDIFDSNTIEFLVSSYCQILEQAVQSSETKISEFELSERLNVNSRPLEKPPKLAISATFTAEPVADSLNFWRQELELGYQIEFAPYNQVFQQLLNPESLLAQNPNGINLVLVRFEDWVRFDDNMAKSPVPAEKFYQEIKRNVQELIQALKEAAAQVSCPYLVCLCPSAPETLADQERVAFLQQMETRMVTELAEVAGVHVVTTAELNTSYPVSKFYHPHGDQFGHVPFTPLFFTTLGTMLARKIYAILQTPYKVIVLDCDQTLWQGICGEDGVIVITPGHQALQEFMVDQHDKGMLLCLCSKNNEEDVIQVFEQHPEMPLHLEHLVSSRINWKPKSENLQSLSQELQLGLDSFIFLDDNPVECADVQANCPEVLTLQLPENRDSIARFLQNLWVFDRIKMTAEDQQRTAFYQRNSKREQLRQKSFTLGEFLSSLELKVQITEMVSSQIGRTAQLTQRTNQFNATTIRRTENEIRNLSQTGESTCLVVEVTDRFGDYGLVGVIIFTTVADILKVDTFLLSCRVLGRGVEHQMLAKLGDIAQKRGLSWVEVIYQPTAKNKPVHSFLVNVGSEFQDSKAKNEHFNFGFVHFKSNKKIKKEIVFPPSFRVKIK